MTNETATETEAARTRCVRARNIAEDSENRIHSDEVARQYGFAGGLVPGVAVYGYLVQPVVRRWGETWLARGTASARFLRPCYDGEELAVTSALSTAQGQEQLELSVKRTVNGELAATGVAHLPATAPAVPDLSLYPTAPLPKDPPPASSTSLAAGTRLGIYSMRLDHVRGAAFADSIDDELPLYRGPNGVAHPALLVWMANRILAENVHLGPWIHAASEVTHFGLARYGDTVVVRGRVAECFERKGHEFAVLDLLLVTGEGRPVQHIRHTAIYRPRLAV